MKVTSETRELIELVSLDVKIRGTYHKPSGVTSTGGPKVLDNDRVGVMFLNGLAATRASSGDAAVYWADSFAERGYPAFRIDLPGHGDSEGDPPTEWLDYINLGGYAPIASVKISELVARYNLSGVIIIGHCAGAVSAIYSAALSKECKGLVLLDPYFHLAQTVRPKIREKLGLWALQTRIGGILRNVYRLLKETRLALRGPMPPENANSRLLRRWMELASTGMPILILKAPVRKTHSAKPAVGEFDYFEYILKLAGSRSKVVLEVADGANHSFSNRLGRAAIQQHIQNWLDDCFPLTEQMEPRATTGRSDLGKLDYEKSEQYLKV